MRLVGAVMKLTSEGAVCITEATRQRYFIPKRELAGLRLLPGERMTFRPARGAHGSGIALDVRRYTRDAG